MAYLKNILSFLSCLLMVLTGPALSIALADGYGNTASAESPLTDSGEGGAPCICCKDKNDKLRGSGPRRAFFYNGSEFLQETDLALPGVIPILIQRTYNNQATFDSPLGYGWDFTFNDRLRTYVDNSVVIRTLTGIKRLFIFTGGVYICEESPHITLIKNPDGSFVFYESSIGNRYHYDRDGRLVRRQNINGNSLRMTYSADLQPLIGTSRNSITPNTPMVVSNNHQLQRIEQWTSNDTSTGRYVDFSYDGSSGRLTSITDSTGRTVSYQHDAYGNLVRVDFPEELFKSYQYSDSNDPHNMTNNLRGHGTNAPVLQVEREYDADDRLVREEYAGGALDIEYTIPLQKTKVTKTVVNPDGDILHQTDIFYEFNTSGYLVKTTDSEKAVELVRDGRNNIIRHIFYINNGTASSPNLELKVANDVIFDTENNIIESSVVLENGETIVNKFSNDNGVTIEQQTYSTARPDRIHKTVIEYNYLDNVPTTIASASTLKGNTPFPSYDSISIQYNIYDQPTKVIYDNGDTTTMAYNNGLLIKHEDTSFNYDTRGNVISIENANGNITQYEYDDLGRNTKVTNPLNEEKLLTYTGWNLTQIEHGKIVGQSGRTTNFVYDDYGRLIQSSTDLAGAPVFQKTYTYDSDGNILTIADQQNGTTTAAYNSWGRLVSHIDADSKTTTYAYSPFEELISRTDPLGQTTLFEYDNLGRQTKIIDPMARITSFTYDELGKITQIIDAESREFSFGYDLAGQRIWQKTPVSVPTWYKYDSRGRVNQITLPDGTSNLYQYNSRNQVEELILSSGTTNSSTLRYGYDKAGNMLWYSDSSIGMEPLYTMTYDAINRLKSKTIVPINKTMQLMYTPQGQRQNLAILDGAAELFHYSYLYDTAGRLISHTEQQQSVTRSIGFSSNSSGFLTGKTYPNGVTASLTYTDNGLLSGLHYRKSDSSTINQFQYTYDGRNRLTEIIDSQGTTSFTYDVLNRLTAANYPAGSALTDENFTYDLTENRLTSNGITDWTYDNSGKLTAYNGHALNYDTYGRQLTETVAAETVTYHYDNLYRLIEAQKTGMQASYNYDYSNRRVKKTVNGNSTWYLYDGGNILAEFDQSTQMIRNYSYTPGSFDLLGITKGAVFQTVITNHLQTPQYVLDSSQSVLWQAAYQSYGKALIDGDVDSNGTAVILNQRFPGQYADSETELYYNWNRTYNPDTGRYISPDPIGINGGVNLFGYANASPLNNIDPMGLFCQGDRIKNYFDGAGSGQFNSCQDLASYMANGSVKRQGGETLKNEVYDEMIDAGYEEVIKGEQQDKELTMEALKDGDIVLLQPGGLPDIRNASHYVAIENGQVYQVLNYNSGGQLDTRQDIGYFFKQRKVWSEYFKKEVWSNPKRIYRYYRVFRRRSQVGVSW